MRRLLVTVWAVAAAASLRQAAAIAFPAPELLTTLEVVAIDRAERIPTEN